MHIASVDVTDKPTCDFKYLSHPLDNEILARHVQYMEILIRTEPLASVLKKDGRRIPAGVNVEALDEPGRWVHEPLRASSILVGLAQRCLEI